MPGQLAMLIAAAFVSFALAGAVFLTNRLPENAINGLARRNAKQVFQLAFFGLYSAMTKEGSKHEVEGGVATLEEVSPVLAVGVYRGWPVIHVFELSGGRLRKN